MSSPLHIGLYIPGMVIDPVTWANRSLGGAETAGVQMAYALAALGHRVDVYCNAEDTFVPWQSGRGAISFLLLRDFAPKGEAPACDVLIVQRLPILPCATTRSRLTVLWQHDLPTQKFGRLFRAARGDFDKCIVLSEFHKREFEAVCGKSNYYVTRNGLDLPLFEGLTAIPRETNRLLYASRPERGLDVLLHDIMPAVWTEQPDANLAICTYNQPMTEEFNRDVVDAMAHSDRIEWLGHLGKRDLYQQMARATLLVYPTPSPRAPTFREISCIAVMEAMACGLPVVASASGALPETLHPAASLLVAGHEQFPESVLTLLGDSKRRESMSIAGRLHANTLDWSHVAKDWTARFEEWMRPEPVERAMRTAVVPPKAKYLFVSNAPTIPSGYGQQTALWAPKWKASGREVAVFGFQGCVGTPTTHNGILVLPRLTHPYGNDVVGEHFRQTGSQIAVTLVDPHVLDPDVYGEIPWCAWTPIDSTPIYPGALHALKAARWIWAMSKFGERALTAAGFNNVFYVPHGIDSAVFRPINRTNARSALAQATGVDLDGKFLVAMVGANRWTPARKGFFEAFSAFKMFVDEHKDAVLYVHAEILEVFGGENLAATASLVGLSVKRIAFAPQYRLTTGLLPPSYLINVYNAADVFLSASHTEGFGLPSIEAQMCGCPVILPDNSAQTEMCLTGRLVDTEPYMTAGHTLWRRPDVAALAEALRWAYFHRRDRNLRGEARERALVYDADRVFEEHMAPTLEAMEQEIA